MTIQLPEKLYKYINLEWCKKYYEAIRLKKETNLNIYEIAEILNIERHSVSKWNRGIRKPFDIRSLEMINDSLTLEKAYILGVLCGDGSIFVLNCNNGKHFIVKLEVIDKDFRDFFLKCLQKYYHHGGKSEYIKNTSFGIVKTYCTISQHKGVFLDLARYGNFGTKTWRVPKEIFKSSNEIKYAFLRGLFDSDGGVTSVNKRFPDIILSSINLKGTLEVQKLLINLGFNPLLQKFDNYGDRKIKYYRLHINKKEDVIKYYKFIGFVIKRKQENLSNLIKNINCDYYKIRRKDGTFSSERIRIEREIPQPTYQLKSY